MNTLPVHLTVISLLFTHTVSYPTPTDTITGTQIFRDTPTDTITSTKIFRDNGASTLISSGGTFELGFFSRENSPNRYVGIWYKNIHERTVVWVANGNNPLTDKSGVLKLVEGGFLVLVNGSDHVIWSTNSSASVRTPVSQLFKSGNPVAQLLESGNLVVRDGNNSKNFVWQSFEHPTDTLLPGMKLGVNFQTGVQVYITSGSGEFTFEFDPTGYPQIFIKKEGVFWYRSGSWNGINFSKTIKLRKNPYYTFGVVMNDNEAYYHYELLNSSVYSRLTVSDTGVGQRWIWEYQKQSWMLYLTVPSDQCDGYNVCGPNSVCNNNHDNDNMPICGCLSKFIPKEPKSWAGGDWSNGCIRSMPLSCENGDAFLKYSSVKLPDTRFTRYNTSMTLEECMVECLKNCSCMAYAPLDISRGENGCLLWFGNLDGIVECASGQDIYVRIASSELESREEKQIILIVDIFLVFGILLLSMSIALYLTKRKAGRIGLKNVDNNPSSRHNVAVDLPLFDLFTISKATDNFSNKNKLGEGGFGPVYKGVLEDGREIAVKRLSKASHQGVVEFKNEVVCIAKLQHRNLVDLLGWCFHGVEMMLIYEYMSNKSLDIILFDPSKSMSLDWPKRLNIINGIARGLMYLHQDSRLRVIHRDLKASNVLLDSKMNPKISDFGLARSFGGNETGANTSRIVGTFGYMSPEYAIEGLFSVKSDVYSFGVLVLEIVCGKKNRGFMSNDHRFNLVGHAWMLYQEKSSLEAADSCLRNSNYLLEIERSIHIGLLCVQERAQDRPCMASVVQMLSNDDPLPEPIRPGFFTSRDAFTTDTSVGPSTTTSQNTMSVTLPEGR